MNKNMKILIVDDFSTMRRIMKTLLSELGYINIDDADDGKTALQKLRSGDFDFLITDLYMPGMHGIELLKAVRADENLAELPVMLVTAEAKREQILLAVREGANGYIIKPFNAIILQEKIEQIYSKLKSTA